MVTAPSGDRRHESGRQADDHRDDGNEAERDRVQPNLRGIRQVGQAAGHEGLKNRRADDDAGGPAERGGHHRFDDELPRHLQPPGAERQARRQFAASRAGPHQGQVREVDRADQQHEARARPQQIQRATDAARQGFVQRRGRAVHAELGEAELREPLDVGGMERVELRLQLLHGGAGPQPPEMKESVARTRAVGLLLGRE